MKEFEAVIFDVDGTLTPEVSWPAMTKGLGASVEEHIKIYNNFVEERISYEEAKGKLLVLWQSTGNANKEFLLSLFTNLPLRPEAKQVIDYLKSRGYLICLLSGGVDLHVQEVARKLEVDSYLTSAELVWDSQGNLVDFHYAIRQGQRKLEQFLEFCRAHGIDSQKCVVVGDDINDLELFIYTGKGIAVQSPTPTSPLEERAWKKIESLKELQELL